MKILSILSVLYTSIFFSTAYAKEGAYQCDDIYQERVTNYKKNLVRKIGKHALPTAGAAAVWTAMVAEFGFNMALTLTIWMPGFAAMMYGTIIGTGIYKLLDHPARIIKGHDILEISKFSLEEITSEGFEEYLVRKIELLNEQRIQLGLNELTDEEIQTVRKNLRYVRPESIFDQFVNKVNKKKKNSKYSYEEVRNALVELAQRDTTFCELKEGKSKENLYTYKKLIKATKNYLIENN